MTFDISSIFGVKKQKMKTLQTLPEGSYSVAVGGDRNLFQMFELNLENGPWIAGGAVLSWLNGKEVESDVDIFFKSQDQYNLTYEQLMTYGFTVFHQSHNARTLKDHNVTLGSSLWNIQLIHREFYDIRHKRC